MCAINSKYKMANRGAPFFSQFNTVLYETPTRRANSAFDHPTFASNSIIFHPETVFLGKIYCTSRTNLHQIVHKGILIKLNFRAECSWGPNYTRGCAAFKGGGGGRLPCVVVRALLITIKARARPSPSIAGPVPLGALIPANVPPCRPDPARLAASQGLRAARDPRQYPARPRALRPPERLCGCL